MQLWEVIQHQVKQNNVSSKQNQSNLLFKNAQMKVVIAHVMVTYSMVQLLMTKIRLSTNSWVSLIYLSKFNNQTDHSQLYAIIRKWQMMMIYSLKAFQNNASVTTSVR